MLNRHPGLPVDSQKAPRKLPGGSQETPRAAKALAHPTQPAHPGHTIQPASPPNMTNCHQLCQIIINIPYKCVQIPCKNAYICENTSASKYHVKMHTFALPVKTAKATQKCIHMRKRPTCLPKV